MYVYNTTNSAFSKKSNHPFLEAGKLVESVIDTGRILTFNYNIHRVQ